MEGLYFFFFVAFFRQVLSSSCHFCTAHGVFFGRQVLLDLDF
jgi:hypothetical protein